MILDKINYPKDLKNLSIEEMTKLAGEIRDLLIKNFKSRRPLSSKFRNGRSNYCNALRV